MDTELWNTTIGRGLPAALLSMERAIELPPDCPVYSAPQSVMDKVVGFHIHRGILALGRRLQAPTARDLLAGLPPGRVTVLAVSGVGADLAAARARAYEGVERIRFAGRQFRRDIGRSADEQ